MRRTGTRRPSARPGGDHGSPILATKLQRPPVPAGAVTRAKLLDRLEDGRRRRFTLISAPPGYGKTTLAAQWLGQSSLPAAWLSLDSGDNHTERLLRYLVAAVRTAVPGFGSELERLLSAIQLPPPEDLAEMTVAAFAQLDDPLLLVLDDCQTVTDPAVQRMLVRILERLPSGVHPVFVTRSDPPWPLAKWRATQVLSEFRAADLGFTEPEAVCFFAGGGLGPRTVERFCRQAEGWVTGLQLMKLSLAGADDAEAAARELTGRDRLIVDYLMDEVVSRQPAEMRTFLSVSALVERFCAPLCDALLADGGAAGRVSRQHLDRLERENLFLVPLDRERRWYRYHHLFRDLMLDRAALQLPRERADRLHRVAGEWFAGEGLLEEGLRHYLAAGDTDAAAALIEAHLHEIIDADLSRRRLKLLLDLLPPETEQLRPGLLVARAYVKLFAWDFAAARQLREQAEELLRAAGDRIPEARRRELEGDLEAQTAFRRYQMGDVAGSLESARRALQLVPPGHRFARGLALMYTAASTAAGGGREEALRLLREARAGETGQGLSFVGQIGLAQMAIEYNAGRMAGAAAAAEQLLAHSREVRVPEYYLSFAYYFRACASYERNQLGAAGADFEAVTRMRPFVAPFCYHDSLVGLALVALAGGDVDRAGEFVQAAHDQAQGAGDSYILSISQVLLNRLAILRGGPADTPLDPPRVFEGNRFLLFTPSLIRLESAVLLGEPEACRALLPHLDAGIAAAGGFCNVRQALQFQAVKALALRCAGRTGAALRLIESAVRTAEPFGLVRTFADRGAAMRELLENLAARRSRTPYLKKLLAAFDGPRGTRTGVAPPAASALPASPPPLFDSPGALSNRELDVLLLLGERLTNKEIAERLHLSLETVKKHNVNIFRKLSVDRRSHAVARATKAGLLPPRRRSS